MPHTRALVVAASLRCRRRCNAAFFQCESQTAYDGHDNISIETWQQFELHELRQSTEIVLPKVLKSIVGIILFINFFRLLQSPSGIFEAIRDFGVVASVSAWTLYLPTWFASSVRGSSHERRLCIIYQTGVITTFSIWAVYSGCKGDVLLAHRCYCINFVLACCYVPHFTHLPMNYRMVVVSIQSALLWLCFHWFMGYLTPPCIAAGICLPILEFAAYRLVLQTRWRLFSLADKERQARLLSDTLKQTLRGVLNVTFDASCECDETGLILHTSKHLAHLLGRSTSELVDVRLQQVAATSAEARRLGAFFQQVSKQKQESALGVTCPPAILGTVLKCSGLQDLELEVKLCCVPLPGDCTVYDDDPSGTGQRFFVGLQTIQSLNASGTNDLASGSSSTNLECESAVESAPQTPGEHAQEHPISGTSSTNVEREMNVGSAPQTPTQELPNVASPLHRNLISEALDYETNVGFLVSMPLGNDDQHSLPGSLSCSAFTIACSDVESQRSRTRSIAVQTARLERLQSSADAATNTATDIMISEKRQLQARPPLLPARHVQRRKQKGVLPKGVRPKRTFLSFQETPPDTITQMLYELTTCANLCCGGCCSFHAHLGFLRQFMKLMVVRMPCQNFDADNKMQCLRCLALSSNEIDGDEDDEDEEENKFCCRYCNFDEASAPNATNTSSEVSSSIRGDDEAESLQGMLPNCDSTSNGDSEA